MVHALLYRCGAVAVLAVLFLAPLACGDDVTPACFFRDDSRIQRLEMEVLRLREQLRGQSPGDNSETVRALRQLAEQQAEMLSLMRQQRLSPPVPQLNPQQAGPSPAPAPQIIVLPIQGQPQQSLPIAGSPWQSLPIQGQPLMVLPIQGPPLQVLPIQGQPQQQLPVQPQPAPRQMLPVAPAAPINPPTGPAGYQRFTHAVSKGW